MSERIVVAGTDVDTTQANDTAVIPQVGYLGDVLLRLSLRIASRGQIGTDTGGTPVSLLGDDKTISGEEEKILLVQIQH